MKGLCIKILFTSIAIIMLVFGLFGFLAYEGITQDYALMSLVGGIFAICYIFQEPDEDGGKGETL